MGKVKAMIMDQEEKLDEYVWYIVSECETFEEFRKKVWDYILNNNLKFVGIYADDTFSRGSLSDVWNEHWSKYNMEGK